MSDIKNPLNHYFYNFNFSNDYKYNKNIRSHKKDKIGR